MTKLNGIGSMSYPQLLELRDRVDAALLTARAAEKQDLRAKMESLATKSGFTLPALRPCTARHPDPQGTQTAARPGARDGHRASDGGPRPRECRAL
jgi:hypothetical protein